VASGGVGTKLKVEPSVFTRGATVISGVPVESTVDVLPMAEVNTSTKLGIDFVSCAEGVFSSAVVSLKSS